MNLALARIAEAAAELSLWQRENPDWADNERFVVVARCLAFAAEHVGATPDEYAAAFMAFVGVDGAEEDDEIVEEVWEAAEMYE